MADFSRMVFKLYQMAHIDNNIIWARLRTFGVCNGYIRKRGLMMKDSDILKALKHLKQMKDTDDNPILEQPKVGFFQQLKINAEDRKRKKAELKAKKEREKEEFKRKELEYHKKLSELKYTTKINLKEMISDLRHFKPSFWNRVKQKFHQNDMCMAIIHYPENRDLVRYYPMVKPFVLEIGKEWYLFSPKAFRYINGMAKLEFYANIPFAILHNVTEQHKPVSLDAEAFTSVQQSKFIQDAVSVEDDKIGLKDIILYIALGLLFIGNVAIIVLLVQMGKHLPK